MREDLRTFPADVGFFEDLLSQFGLDLTLFVRTLILAIVSGVVAVLIDEGLALPANNMAITAGAMVGVLNGLTYAAHKRRADKTGLGAGLVNGWLAYFVWYLTLHIFAHDSALIATLDWFEATITGVLSGIMGFGFFAAVVALRD